MWVCTPDRNDFKLGTVVVLVTVWRRPILILGSKGEGSGLEYSADLHLQKAHYLYSYYYYYYYYYYTK